MESGAVPDLTSDRNVQLDYRSRCGRQGWCLNASWLSRSGNGSDHPSTGFLVPLPVASPRRFTWMLTSALSTPETILQLIKPPKVTQWFIHPSTLKGISDTNAMNLFLSFSIFLWFSSIFPFLPNPLTYIFLLYFTIFKTIFLFLPNPKIPLSFFFFFHLSIGSFYILTNLDITLSLERIILSINSSG